MAIQTLPTLDRFAGLRQGSQNFVQQFLQRKQQEKQLADQQALLQFVQQKRAGGQQGAPQFQTAQGAAGATNFLGQQPTAVQQQQEKANLALTQARTGALGNPDAGKQTSSVITDPNDPNKAIRIVTTTDAAGNVVNQQKVGDATLAEKIGGVAAEGLQKATKGKLEKDIIDLSQTLTELGSIDERMQPDSFGGDFTFEDFFTLKGKADAKITDIAKQLGISRSEASNKFLSAKATFGADSKRVFLKFRKFITGVAGGIKEFQEIAKASIDPDKGSSITFKAKFDSMRDSALRTQNMLLAMRNSGLDPNKAQDRRKAFEGRSLSDIPLEVSPDVTLDTLKAGNNKTPEAPGTPGTPGIPLNPAIQEIKNSFFPDAQRPPTQLNKVDSAAKEFGF